MARKKYNYGSPFDYWQAAFDATKMMAEANTVIAMRVMGMNGIWSVKPDENTRMVTEKTTAFTKSAMAMQMAMIKNANPAQIMSAGLKPVGRVTAANQKRLGRRGLK